jgi:hypothetical protein
MSSVLEARVLARALRDQRRRGTLERRQAPKEWREELMLTTPCDVTAQSLVARLTRIDAGLILTP